ncbi:hypothetical protein [Nonomuraea dietziae]|uniref:hypothetical protein n=1 Tax=Nonomuraea dietziae TaxID=65515 RepID=UPI0031DE5E8E
MRRVPASTSRRDAALNAASSPCCARADASRTRRILAGCATPSEAHHQVRITDDALDAARAVSARYIADRLSCPTRPSTYGQAAARVRLRARAPAADVRELEDGWRRCAGRRTSGRGDEFDRAKEADLGDRQAHGPSSRTSLTATTPVPECDHGRLAELFSRRTRHPRLATRRAGARPAAGAWSNTCTSAIIRPGRGCHRRSPRPVRRARAACRYHNRPIVSFLFLARRCRQDRAGQGSGRALFGGEDHIGPHRHERVRRVHYHGSGVLCARLPIRRYEEAGQLTSGRPPPTAHRVGAARRDREGRTPDVMNLLLQMLDATARLLPTASVPHGRLHQRHRDT